MDNAADNIDQRAGTLRFVLDGQIIELSDVDPTQTVLQFLREELRRTGTKEGCAEGDCGACTVVLAEIDRAGDALTLRAVNSCIQFLPTLHGKELITVESLNSADGDLHPVQQAMVDCHGSQCGFCTPGFVMSLFALYENNAEPTRREIDDALAGNLCRCTGYRPIIEAAQSMREQASRQSDSFRASPERLRQLQRLAADDQLDLESNGRKFLAPKCSEQLARALSKQPKATILAGGTDVGLWVTKQHRELRSIVYTGCVDELNRLSLSETHIEIGAAVTLTDAMELIVAHYPALDELFRRFASPPIRNAGTLGGNIANGSPIGDSMPALMVAGTTLVLRSIRGAREIPLTNFYVDYQVNELEPDEFIETVRIPLPVNDVILRSHKLSKRFDQDISAVCSAYRLQLDDERVQSFAMACGGLAATVRRASNCESAIVGKKWSAANVATASTALAKDFAPISDMRATAGYRLRATQNLLRRFYLETTGQVKRTVYEYGR